ncbi:MAG: hypothetical protein AAF587_15995 [Bacteroidota bacterium]
MYITFFGCQGTKEKDPMMNHSSHVLRSILIALPVWGLFSLLLYFFIAHYDFIFAKYIGQVLLIPTFMLGVYSLALPFSSYKTQKKDGWEVAVQQHIRQPWLSYIPWGIAFVVISWTWIVYSQLSLYWAVETRFPMDLSFVMACLFGLNEGLRTSTRKKHFDLYLQSQKAAVSSSGKKEDYISRTKWSIPQLKIAFYLLPLVNVFGGWTVMILIFYAIRDSTSDFFSSDLQAILLMISGGAMWYYLIQFEKRVEQWARDKNYIPWFSEWNSDKDLVENC